jgi:hypothetical protein
MDSSLAAALQDVRRLLDRDLFNGFRPRSPYAEYYKIEEPIRAISRAADEMGLADQTGPLLALLRSTEFVAAAMESSVALIDEMLIRRPTSTIAPDTSSLNES